MKLKSETTLPGSIIMALYIFEVLPPLVTAGMDLDIKNNYK